MSNINWKQGSMEKVPEIVAGKVITVAEEPTTAALVGAPSPNTTYRIHDNENGTFVVIVLEKRGKGTINNVVAQDVHTLLEAQIACQQDWDSGKRT
jgi:hypothetical protein